MIRNAVLGDYQMINSFDPSLGVGKEDILENRVFVYLEEGAVCGFLSISRAKFLGRPYVEYLAVKPDSRRKGVASNLLGYVEEKYSSQRLFISTESDNNSMQKLLAKRGYTHAGEISGANLNGTNEIYYYR